MSERSDAWCWFGINVFISAGHLKGVMVQWIILLALRSLLFKETQLAWKHHCCA